MRADGYCERGKHWLLEHPNLVCQWCHDLAPAHPDLALDPEVHPERVIAAVQGELKDIHARAGILVGLRARASRALLAQPDKTAAAKRAHHRVRTLEGWATRDTPRLRTRRAKTPPPTAEEAQVRYAERLALREQLLERRAEDLKSEQLLPPL